MAKTARKGKKAKFDLDRLYPVLNVLCILLAVSNFVVIFLFERSKAPKIERIYETVTTNHFIVVTNTIVSSSADSPSAVSDSFPGSTLDSEILVSYKYFLIDGTRHIEYCGRYFSEGSPTSYGRIVTIFPDRVLLDNGRYLKNRDFSDSFASIPLGVNKNE